MSSKRDRRSRSDSRSSDVAPSKPKRTLDLVTTRNLTPPRWHSRGRGRSMRRPFVYRGHRGMNTFRGSSQRFYPRKRFDSRDDSYSRHRRSRSRSAGHGRGRSGSRDRHRRSRSKSSGSEGGSRHRSKNQERRQSDWKDGKHSRSRDAASPESRSTKKKRRHSSPSPDHRRQQSHKARSSRSHSKERSPSRSQNPSATSLTSRSNKHEDDVLSSYRQGNRYQEDEGERHREKSRSRSPEVTREKRSSASVSGSSKGKELIPRNRLHKIFTLISQDNQFELEEDISIAIQRNPYAEPSEDSTVTLVFDPELFSMIYPYEGRKHKPIFDREEIKVFGHDKNLADDPDFERRVIRLKPGKSSQQTDSSHLQSGSYQHSASLEITRTVRRDRSRSSSRSDSGSNLPSRHKETKFRLRVSTDPRFEARYAKLQGQDESVRSRHTNLDPSDLRHELSSHRNTSSDARGHIDRDRDRREDRPRSLDARDSRPDQNKDKEELPDFSRRKDKYTDLPWLYDPESIPKDPKYFMHDDREGQDPRDRGRGRGRFFRGRFNSRRPFRPFRGRGGYRGNYFRGKGNYSSDPRSLSPRRSYSGQRREYNRSPEREWKHDKFTELEHEGEKKSHGDDERHEYPHSTSER